MKFRFRHYNFTHFSRVAVLCFVWLIGLVAGTLVVAFWRPDAALLNSAVAKHTSWILPLLITGPSLLLCTVALWKSWFAVNCALVGVQSFCRGCCGYWFYLSYGSGAWLIRSGVLFSSAINSVLLWWLIFRYYFINAKTVKKDLLLALFLMILFTSVDRLLVSPLLIQISSYI